MAKTVHLKTLFSIMSFPKGDQLAFFFFSQVPSFLFSFCTLYQNNILRHGICLPEAQN